MTMVLKNPVPPRRAAATVDVDRVKARILKHHLRRLSAVPTPAAVKAVAVVAAAAAVTVVAEVAVIAAAIMRTIGSPSWRQERL